MDHPSYNNVPFSTAPAAVFLPAVHTELENQFKTTERHMPSFFTKPPFVDSSTYRPPSDFLTRPRRTSGVVPDSSYPQKLADWFYPSDAGHPFVYEEARELYFSISIPFSVLSGAFQGHQAVPASARKTYLLNFVSKYDCHLVCILLLGLIPAH